MPSYIDGAAYTRRNCACCGKLFFPKLADVHRGWGRYCSNACKNEGRRRTAQRRKTWAWKRKQQTATDQPLRQPPA